MRRGVRRTDGARARQALALMLWLLLLQCPSALAWTGGAVPQVPGRLGLEIYGPDEGLSQSTVNSLAHDDQGFLWIATQEGLNRFDGHRFEVYRRGPTEDRGLASSSVDSLAFEASAQRLWLGTNDSGLEVVHLPSWERRQVTVADGLSHSLVTKILLDTAGGAWVGTGAGVDRVDAAARNVLTLGASAEVEGLVAYGEGGALALDRRCVLWHVERDAMSRVATLAESDDTCSGLAVGDEGAWVARERSGLSLHDPASGRTLRRYPMSSLRDAPDTITALARLDDGSVLVGFGSGHVSHLPAGAGAPRPLRLDRDLESAVTSFHQDADASLWIGTYTAGLYQVRPLSEVIRHGRADATELEGWPSRSLRALWRGAGQQLVGTDAGLMRRSDGESTWRPVPGFEGQSVRVVRAAADGGWWVGTQSGLWRWHDGSAPKAITGLPDRRIDDLLVEDDTVWAATRGGLARIEQGQVVDDPALAPLHGRSLTSLLRDREGSLWIGSNADGLWRIDADGVPSRYRPATGELHESLWSLHEGADALWVGSFSGGLFRVDRARGEVLNYGGRDGLGSDVVYGILEDRHGRLWLSTNNGLAVLDPGSGVVQNLGPRDGLQNREYNSGSALRAQDGTMYFGGTRGLDVVDPAALPLRSSPARPVLATLRRPSPTSNVGDTRPRESSLVYAREVALGHGDGVFSIEMTAIDFSAPDAARLRYRLRGLHEEWVYPQAPRADFSVSHLPPGHYVLEVEAAGRDGQFGATRSLAIDMAPPWWRHPLAFVAYVVLGLLLVAWQAGRMGAAVRRERRRVELLNRTVAERTAQLQEANQKLLHTNEQLDAATRRDPLTRISNRRDLQDWLGRETAALRQQLNAADSDEQLVFFMIDIDDFKQVNDRHGHQAGDEVLVHFADRLRVLSREPDLLVRWGGEEFLLIARLTRREDATRLAQRIRDAIAMQPIRIRPGLVLDLGCSIGFAPWPFSTAWPALGEWEESLALADRCLYAAKRSGKNTWVGLAPGPAPRREAVQALLAGAAPDEVGAESVTVLSADATPPPFAP